MCEVCVCVHVWRSEVDKSWDLVFSLYYVGPGVLGTPTPLSHINSSKFSVSALSLNKYKLVLNTSSWLALISRKTNAAPSEGGWVILEGRALCGDNPSFRCVCRGPVSEPQLLNRKSHPSAPLGTLMNGRMSKWTVPGNDSSFLLQERNRPFPHPHLQYRKCQHMQPRGNVFWVSSEEIHIINHRQFAF